MQSMLVSCIKPTLSSLFQTDCSTAGLFAPRAGQNFRDEQRRRRSQYDRGTRHAEIEDSYETHHHESRNEPDAFHAVSPYGRPAGACYPGYGAAPS